jgi:hypothetical protein
LICFFAFLEASAAPMAPDRLVRSGLRIVFGSSAGAFKQRYMVPESYSGEPAPPVMGPKTDLEAAVHCAGGNRIDPRMNGGDPGVRLGF